MLFENPLTFLRAIKGAPASILLAFFFVQRAMTNLELQTWTGYKDDAITPALKLLVDLGWLIARSPRGPWCLAEGRQLPLMEISGLNGYPDDVVVNVESEESKSLLSTTTTNRAMNPFKPDSSGRVVSVRQVVKDPEEIKACLAVLHDLKIYGKKADQIAEDHHITVDYIQAHWKVIQGQTWDNPQGMLIYMLQSHAPAVEPDSDQGNGGNRYTSGSWGNYLNGESEDA